MSASLFPGSCRILPGLVSMATGSQQAARQLEGSRQAKQAGKEGLGSKRKTEVVGVVGVSQEAGRAPKPSSQPLFSSDHESEGSLGHGLFLPAP